MEKILDFNCTFNSAAGIDRRIIERLGLEFPDAYMHAGTLAQIALAVKEAEQAPFCILPLCHTVEGEALGAEINYGNGEFGPRAGKQICDKAEEILELPDMDFSRGRIYEVLKACRELREKGEHVVLEISGPFTILDTLADAGIIFRTMRKQPEVMEQVLEKLRKNILAYFAEAQRAGVDLISYADSSGGVNILGPKLAEQIATRFTYPLLKDVERTMENAARACEESGAGKNAADSCAESGAKTAADSCVESDEESGTKTAMVLLCPKTSFALLGAGKARWEEVQLSEPMTYAQACIDNIGKVKFAGQMCIKNTGYMLSQRIFKEIKLL